MREHVTDDVVIVHPDINYQPLVARVTVVNSNRADYVISPVITLQCNGNTLLVAEQ